MSLNVPPQPALPDGVRPLRRQQLVEVEVGGVGGGLGAGIGQVALPSDMVREEGKGWVLRMRSAK